jgi:hypothetical protein
MIKAIFFDMDGTLVAHPEGIVPDSTKEAIHKARKNGVKTFLATGRHKLEMDGSPMLKDVEMDGFAGLNGQYCYHSDEVIWKKSLDHNDIAFFLEYLRENPFPCIFEEENVIYGNFLNEKLKKILEDVSIDIPEFRSLDGLEKHDFYQLIPICEEETMALIMKNMPNTLVTNWGKHTNDLIPKDGGKVVGIEKFLTHYGFGWDEVMAIGDGMNDMEMIKAAGISVAMGNGNPLLKEKADYVTANVHEDGVYLAMKHFGLIG